MGTLNLTVSVVGKSESGKGQHVGRNLSAMETNSIEVCFNMDLFFVLCPKNIFFSTTSLQLLKKEKCEANLVIKMFLIETKIDRGKLLK